MKTTTQLAILLGNRPGGLARVCRELADGDINIDALAISDAVDNSLVRMVVSDTKKAVNLLEDHGLVAVESEVLVLENDNRPGTLADVTDRLATAGVNIEYAYLAMSPRCEKGLMIIRPSDMEKAKDALKDYD